MWHKSKQMWAGTGYSVPLGNQVGIWHITRSHPCLVLPTLSWECPLPAQNAPSYLLPGHPLTLATPKHLRWSGITRHSLFLQLDGETDTWMYADLNPLWMVQECLMALLSYSQADASDSLEGEFRLHCTLPLSEKGKGSLKWLPRKTLKVKTKFHSFSEKGRTFGTQNHLF